LDLIGRIERGAGNWAGSRDAHAQALEIRSRTRGMLDAHTIESASRLYVALHHLGEQDAMRDVRGRFLDPVVALDPASLNASMRSVSEDAGLALDGRWAERTTGQHDGRLVAACAGIRGGPGLLQTRVPAQRLGAVGLLPREGGGGLLPGGAIGVGD